jgi:O-antigen ligase
VNRALAFTWLVIIGTNVADYYSDTAPYQGYVVLAGAAYFLFTYRRDLVRLLFFADYLLVLGILIVPVLLMLLSDRSFERGAFTSQIAVALAFVVASVLAMRSELKRPLILSVFCIVAVGAVLNIYELLLGDQIWSVAPGRSAGFYRNPNISAEALVGFGVLFLLARSGRFNAADMAVTSLAVVGTFATFSRAGIVGGLLLLVAAAMMRGQRSDIPRIVVGGVMVSLVALVFAAYVMRTLDLSEDAANRIVSLIEQGGIGDYWEDRGLTGQAWLELAMENPLAGVGVGAAQAMDEGPHNMFLAMWVDYGIAGLVAYLWVIVRLALTARMANRGSARSILLFVAAWLVLFGFASHNLLGNAATIPLLGFALASSFRIRWTRRTSRIEFKERGRGPAMNG